MKLILAVAILVMLYGLLGVEIAHASTRPCAMGTTHRQERRELRCLIARVRERHGLPAVGGSRLLHRAAARKGADIRSCGFSHTACGRPMSYWPRALGFCRAGVWDVGENLAAGYGSPRAVMRAWMASPTHRANLLGRWDSVGVSFRGSTWVLETGACA